MKYIDLTLPTPQQNLACDEALLHWCEEVDGEEILRFWEPREYFAVLGYSGKIKSEVYLFECQASRIPILRRLSGGGTVLQGPGCLSYSLILKINDRASLKGITETNSFVLSSLAEALKPLTGSAMGVRGFSDLTLGELKVSGNAQYRRRHFLLFHGTLLLNFDISLVEKLLPIPSKQPPYRQNRPHGAFLTNLNLPPQVMKEQVKKSWSAQGELEKIPFDEIERLVKQRYANDEWNFRF